MKDEAQTGQRMPSNPEEVEDLRREQGTNPLIAFTFLELKTITGNFRKDHVLGGGGFGRVYKGYVPRDLRQGIHPIDVAVKVHDGNRSFQGHREWLVVSLPFLPPAGFLSLLLPVL